MSLYGQPLCALCVLAFEQDAPPVTGYRPASAGSPRERVFNVQLGQVLSGAVAQCHNTNGTSLPMLGVTMVQGTVVCQHHTRVLLDPVLNATPPPRRVGMFGGFGG